MAARALRKPFFGINLADLKDYFLLIHLEISFSFKKPLVTAIEITIMSN